MSEKNRTMIRLTDWGMETLKARSKELGVSQGAYLEGLMRREEERLLELQVAEDKLAKAHGRRADEDAPRSRQAAANERRR